MAPSPRVLSRGCRVRGHWLRGRKRADVDDLWQHAADQPHQLYVQWLNARCTTAMAWVVTNPCYCSDDAARPKVDAVEVIAERRA